MAPVAESGILEPYPIYNTTFTLHRVSPLYTGTNTPLDNAALQQHAKRFRDILAGDVLRGVRVGLGPEDDVLARVGALKSVTWEALPEEELWRMDEEMKMDTTVELGAGKGILVQVAYEKMLYRAILLHGERDRGQDEPMIHDGQNGFQHFPLLLTRMPASLRDTLTDFLATTFDARIAVLHLSGPYLSTTFEKFISDCLGEDGEEADLVESSMTLRNVVKDVQVLIGFDFPTTASLQTIEFHIGQEDLPRLVQRGKRIGDMESPFMNALSNFVQGHMALDLKHEKVRILRIACGAFVLGAEGRIKLTEPAVDSVQTRSTWNLVEGLVGISKGGKMYKDAT